MKKNLASLYTKKKNGIPITMVTAYDFPTARIADAVGVDAVLVGDSVGTNMLGYASEREVSMADMLHHAAAVARGTREAFLLADLPFRSVDTGPDAEKNSFALIERGITCVKLEGWREKCGIVAHLSNNKIPVCAHIGYNPQLHGPKPKVFGSTVEEARELVESARKLEEAGAVLLVLEKITEEVAGSITKELRIPTIGIGSGRLCDGQVLVMNDLLGMTGQRFKHARAFMDFNALASEAIKSYVAEVEKRNFPAEQNVHHAGPDVVKGLKILN
jgi:3-methyl-2-oxobutanoate hydroxymethyltransferase